MVTVITSFFRMVHFTVRINRQKCWEVIHVKIWIKILRSAESKRSFSLNCTPRLEVVYQLISSMDFWGTGVWWQNKKKMYTVPASSVNDCVVTLSFAFFNSRLSSNLYFSHYESNTEETCMRSKQTEIDYIRRYSLHRTRPLKITEWEIRQPFFLFSFD